MKQITSIFNNDSFVRQYIFFVKKVYDCAFNQVSEGVSVPSLHDIPIAMLYGNLLYLVKRVSLCNKFKSNNTVTNDFNMITGYMID